MRPMCDWKCLLVAGAALVLAGCGDTTAPQLSTASRKRANDSSCSLDSRTGYFVRSGHSYYDGECSVEVPN